MYFDIVPVYYHQTRKQRTPTPDRRPRTQQGKQRGEGEANQRIVRVARYNRPVMGLPCWPLVFLFFLGGGGGCPACESGMNAPGIRHSASCKNAFEGEQLTICGSLSPLWGCNLALVRQEFIESSVVKLDYGKVSTTDLSSFDIPLWYTELQEMI